MKKIIAVFLALIIAATASVNAFAASAKKTYISDLVAVTAASEMDAKAQLTKEGYKLLNGSNVNSSLKTKVFIGYKETTNADEAITDIAAMNMTGKFSYSDYEQIMEQNKEQIKETIDNFEPVIAEFQTNYDSDVPEAVAVYTALNTFKDDDSGKLMGDYLLGYDFSDAAEKKMTNTFMQANSQIILAIMQQTAFAGDDEEGTLIDRMVKTGPDGISKKYKGLYPSVGAANRAMAAEYGDTAAALYNDWSSVYTYITNIENNIKVASDGTVTPTDELFDTEERSESDYDKVSDAEEKDIVQALDCSTDMLSITADEIDFALYNLLNMTEYGDATLLEFFNRPASEVKKEELYPLVDAMSDGQRSQVEMNGLLLTLESALSAVEPDTAEAEDAIKTVKDVTEMVGEISIFSGVDRSVFEDGVAFTSAATEHEQLTGESWLTKLGYENEKTGWLVTMITSSVITGALIAAFITASAIQNAEKALIASSEAQHKALVDAYNGAKQDFYDCMRFCSSKRYQTFKNLVRADVENIDDAKRVLKVYETKWDDADKALENFELHVENKSLIKTTTIIKCVSFVLLVVMLAVDIYVIYEYITTPEPEEEKIPHHLMTVATTAYGEEFVYYETVKNLKGEAQDTNNHEAEKKIGWLTLYTTKDIAAGAPILAESLKAQTGSAAIKEDVSFIHLFNETSALNLTAELYTGADDKVNGTYILFDRESSSTLVGSAITNGTAALIGVGGLAIGVVFGVLVSKLAAKKKKNSPSAA